MKEYSLGSDKLDNDYDLAVVKDADIVVYDYENYGYEGDGYLVAVKDSKYYYCYLGHCSCYGPTDDFKYDKPYNNLIILKAAMINNTYGSDNPRIEGIINKLKEVLS
jgi:hypothetical protein